MTDLPDDMVRKVEALLLELARRDSPDLRAHAATVQGQYKKTRAEVDRVEFLLGRSLTRGEVHWLHRRLNYGLRVPADAELDYDFESLDAAYRERLARSEGPWRGPLDDIPEQLRDLLPES